jgi:transcriptional regulator with PAS, ATPase and Fis domain
MLAMDVLDQSLGAAILFDAEGAALAATPGLYRLWELKAGLPSATALGLGNLQLATARKGLMVMSGHREYPTQLTQYDSGFVLRVLPRRSDDHVNFYGMVSAHPSMRELFRVIERIAKEEVTVLIRGETGSGKELVAEALHKLSPRKKGPFRPINCAAIPPNLLESELFGHSKGAFTGAIRDVPGHFSAAHKGTIFLDEVAEIPLDLQAKLLRVLETRTVIPVGAREAIPIDVRIVSATHRSLRREVEAGRFRADLMYRLRVFPLYLPPLREREGDPEVLTAHFIEALNRVSQRQILSVHPSARDILASYNYPGNVRELQNILQYAFAIGDGSELSYADLPTEVTLRDEPRESMAPPPMLPRNLGFSLMPPPVLMGSSIPPQPEKPPSLRAREASRPPASRSETPKGEAEVIRSALRQAEGDRREAAHALGMSRVTLWRKMTKLGLLKSQRR